MEKDIGRINKNDTTDIVVRVDDFGGVNGLTIREFVTSDRYTGFTKSGVRILGKDFQSFKEMINSIDEKDLESNGSSSGSEDSSPEKQTEKDSGQETLDSEEKDEGSENSDEKEELPDY